MMDMQDFSDIFDDARGVVIMEGYGLALVWYGGVTLNAYRLDNGRNVDVRTLEERPVDHREAISELREWAHYIAKGEE